MARPRAVLRLSAECFGESFVCSGRQIAAVAQLLEQAAGPLQWWVAAVELVCDVSPDGLGTGELPARCGGTSALVKWAKRVGNNQLLWGVMIALRADAPPSAALGPASALDLRGDLGDAVAEVRAFDTTFIAVSLAERKVAAAIQAGFPGAVRA